MRRFREHHDSKTHRGGRAELRFPKFAVVTDHQRKRRPHVSMQPPGGRKREFVNAPRWREVLELVLFLSACPACKSFMNLEDSMSESAQVPGLTNKLQPGDGRPRKKQHWRRGSCATVRSCARSTNAQGRDDPGLERRKDVIRGRQRAQPIRVVRSLRLARTWFLVSCTRSFVSLRCSSTAGSMLVFMRSRRKP